MLSFNEIEQLIEKLDGSSIDEFSLESNGMKIALKKNRVDIIEQEVVQSRPVSNRTVTVPQVEESQSVAQSETKQDTKEESTAPASYDHEIVSPMVGTFYSAPSPEKPPFVQQGDSVDKNTVVCIVEAMKLFNEIEAEVSGTVTEILVENGELVEYGQPLFRIKTK
ncbi:acetyl-CoA carboxylase biotin carboxyl carrier protein [Gracilibacillus halotolerans]|uniref:Biotin carboxyl carrier protein of acetyl-CoA carboxylase n=1 Tax=Gracilibacillus halotolerans TaxID=74386 RepID=A0A841RKN1_9BACI|nr:acetyl-CoA carboxylase biotin carboxyl carrier protein [Gracilibacillus halotolerans]MBB6511755.1 acetyl-CoA carboxylase biotin carboxyl carrier protein [Gracilibacillus halotolerans]